MTILYCTTDSPLDASKALPMALHKLDYYYATIYNACLTSD